VLSLVAVLHPSALDARRGVVRLHPEAMAALGIGPWDAVQLNGVRSTGALAAVAPGGSAPGQVLCDELVLGNLRLRDGSPVQVSKAPEQAARTVVLAGPPEVVAAVDPALLRTAMLGKVVTTGDNASLVPQDLAPVGAPDPTTARRSLRARLGPAAGTVLLTVAEADPPGPSLVTMATVVGWQGGTSTTGSATVVAAGTDAAPRLADLPGLEAQARQLREWLDLGFHHADLLARLGTGASMGVLLTGAAGSGKAALVQAVTAEVGARLVRAWGPQLAALELGAAAQQVRALLQPPGAPTVLLLEDVEALAPREGGGPLRTTFVAELRPAVATGRLAVVCTTARPEAVDPSLRAPGLLDHELAVPLPDRAQRRRLLAVATGPVPLAEDVDLDDAAARTPGFVAADLIALVREAGLRAAARQREAGAPVLAREDLDAALQVVRPTALEGAPLQLGGLTLEDVGDMAEVKAALTEAVLWPLQYPDTFARLGVSAPRGVLLYGPPGCGKTFLVKAIAGSGQANVLSVKGAELLSKWVGESEAAVRELFRRARESAPSLVFLDEIDALAPQRGAGTDGGTTDRVVAALLTELDGVESLRDVVVIGATNRPDLIDAAMLRPGRLERLVFVPPPDAEARAAVLRAAARDVPLDAVDLEELGRRTEGFSAADCAALVREAALTAMRESMRAATVTAAHLEAALRVVRPSLNPMQVEALARFAADRAAR
jgi:transitional endoplasmic reticulum ATPase